MNAPGDTFTFVLWLFFEQGVWAAWITSPVWWAAFKAWRHRDQLPHRLAFVVVSAALAYGLLAAFSIVVVVPLKVAALYLAPQLTEFGAALGAWLNTAATSATALLFPLALSLPVSAWWGARRLARDWPRLCGQGGTTSAP